MREAPRQQMVVDMDCTDKSYRTTVQRVKEAKLLRITFFRSCTSNGQCSILLLLLLCTIAFIFMILGDGKNKRAWWLATCLPIPVAFPHRALNRKALEIYDLHRHTATAPVIKLSSPKCL